MDYHDELKKIRIELEHLRCEIRIIAEALNSISSKYNEVSEYDAETEIEAYDKEERRKADKEKNQQMHDLEVKKSKLSWDRVLLEVLSEGNFR